jgi:hypothetical protein
LRGGAFPLGADTGGLPLRGSEGARRCLGLRACTRALPEEEIGRAASPSPFPSRDVFSLVVYIATEDGDSLSGPADRAAATG